MLRRILDGGRRRPVAVAAILLGVALALTPPALRDAAERLVAGEARRQAEAWAAGTGGAESDARPGAPLRVRLGEAADGDGVRLDRVAAPGGPRTEATVHLRLSDAAAAVTYDVSPTMAAVRQALGLGALVAAGLAVLSLATGLLLRARVGAEGGAPSRHMQRLPGPADFIRAARRLRVASPGAVAVVAIDVDRFRDISARLGEVGAEALLARLARELRRSLRRRDVVGRFGHDEFVAVAALDSPGALAELTTRVADRLCLLAEARAGATVSVGAGLLEAGPETIEAGLKRARLALSEAKRAGGGRGQLFTPEMERRFERRREIERAVRDGGRLGRFALAFQPVVAAGDGRTVGCEALMRLVDAKGRAIPPCEFIPVAEEIGHIDSLGAWALRRATREAARWPAPMRVAVNLSVRQFRHGGLLAEVRDALEGSGLAPHRLELEVTESLLVVDPEGVRRQLDALKALGVTVAMDDFGTGYSSLAYLWHFGFDRLKLDRAFVRAIAAGDARALDVTAAILDLAHRLGMEVTAEGVETDREARILSDLGCDALQGFRFGQPMAGGELSEVMRWTADAEAEAASPAASWAAGPLRAAP
ncbi:MAG: GGDEF domain-containing phosphodiesterase [Paracoccaceae bacterium]